MIQRISAEKENGLNPDEPRSWWTPAHATLRRGFLFIKRGDTVALHKSIERTSKSLTNNDPSLPVLAVDGLAILYGSFSSL
ncbi:uncharacterized protein PHALS_11337 [Plasmopara halstedii]|uniref:Uncharacterized protein n=1 Tax=Plasmopara halstedii TaxID=4781 RepID=A0A0P1A5Q5_PLAHL|nr:uncharacterized protein PHALS_11337 [Plasmopara halstedii]CEG35457.1 hypothetical protein PHALS_11337 [Plasmopara halstedii]|eukprot:XP_024571826.1 hypothetical protein PHALS_11337 [Plasmopara halstedii]